MGAIARVTEPMQASPGLIGRGVGLGDGAVETGLGGLGVGVQKIDGAIDDLVGADGSPVKQVGGVIDVEPRAVGTSGAELEALAGQHAGERARELAVKNERGGALREADQIIGGRRKLEDDSAVDIWWAIINRHECNQSAAFPGGDGDRARKRDIIRTISASAPDVIRDQQVGIRITIPAHGEGGVLRSAIGEEPASGDIRTPVGPSGGWAIETEPGSTIGAFDGQRIGGDYADDGRPIRWRWQSWQDSDLHRLRSTGRAAVIDGLCGEDKVADGCVAPDEDK